MLINCPECNKQISDKATQCIHCGFPLKEYLKNDDIDKEILKKYINDDKIGSATKYVAKTLNISLYDAKKYIQDFAEKENCKKSNPLVKKKVDNRPKCPTCQSTNIRKIGSGERVASVVGLGLFSRKINKTWMCNNCKHTW